jgi:hypothetical protein
MIFLKNKIERKPFKVIFLDMDGVIVDYTKNRQKDKPHSSFGEIASRNNPQKEYIENLNKITDATRAKIVISSAWRVGETSISFWNKYFYLLGIKGDVIDVTPYLSTDRGNEILTWLVSYLNVQYKTHRLKDYDYGYYYGDLFSFVIIDDDTDMGLLLPYLVNTPKCLTSEKAQEAIKKLQKPCHIKISME